jgi:ribonuclease P protein component
MAPVQRLRGHKAFHEIRQSRNRVRRGPLTVRFLVDAVDVGDAQDAHFASARVGYAIGKHVGPATVRNHLRRQLRSAMSGLATQLPKGDYLIGAGPAAAGMKYSELEKLLSGVVGGLSGRDRRTG